MKYKYRRLLAPGTTTTIHSVQFSCHDMEGWLWKDSNRQLCANNLMQYDSLSPADDPSLSHHIEMLCTTPLQCMAYLYCCWYLWPQGCIIDK